MRALWIAVAIWIAATGAFGQGFPKAEIFAGYSYANLPVLNNRSNANGWSASATVNIYRWFGLTSDLGGIVWGQRDGGGQLRNNYRDGTTHGTSTRLCLARRFPSEKHASYPLRIFWWARLVLGNTEDRLKFDRGVHARKSTEPASYVHWHRGVWPRTGLRFEQESRVESTGRLTVACRQFEHCPVIHGNCFQGWKVN